MQSIAPKVNHTLRTGKDWVQQKWHMSLVATGYYFSSRVIFHTEVALIMLCCMDFTMTVTLFGILLATRINYAHKYTAWAVNEHSDIHLPYWGGVFVVFLSFCILESIVRIYYCLKLAYFHNQKAKDGELCCMECHMALLCASMSSDFVLPHLLGALALIAFFVYAYVDTGPGTVKIHRDYFANSPFVHGTAGLEEMRQTLYFTLGKEVLQTMQSCLRNTSSLPGVEKPAEAGAVRLLTSGRLLDVVHYDCAKKHMHCTYAKHFLQLTVESVQALLNYAAIRCLFGHVINMHQYEVYNQQRRLLMPASGSSRLFRVYKVRHRRTQRQSRFSGMMQLPRQALRSLINLGTNVASRFRSSYEVRTHELHMTPKDDPLNALLEDEIAEKAMDSMDDSTWFSNFSDPSFQTGASTQTPTLDKGLKDDGDRRGYGETAMIKLPLLSEPKDKNGEADDVTEGEADYGLGEDAAALPLVAARSRPVLLEPAIPVPTMFEPATPQNEQQQQQQPEPQQQQDQIESQMTQLYNRKEAARAKKVNFEYLKIPDLFPDVLTTTNDTQEPQSGDQTTATTAGQSEASAKRKSKTRKLAESQTVSYGSGRSGGSRPKRVNDSIFTDETFYSLDT